MSQPGKLSWAQIAKTTPSRKHQPPEFVRFKSAAQQTDASDTNSTDTSPSTHKDDDPCPLKKLPAELRNYIFLLASLEPEPIRLAIRPNARDIINRIRSHLDKTQHFSGLALSSTCRQFRQETAAVFYAENTFTLMINFNKCKAQKDALQFPSKSWPHSSSEPTSHDTVQRGSLSLSRAGFIPTKGLTESSRLGLRAFLTMRASVTCESWRRTAKEKTVSRSLWQSFMGGVRVIVLAITTGFSGTIAWPVVFVGRCSSRRKLVKLTTCCVQQPHMCL